MFFDKTLITRCLLILLPVAALSGCAFGKFGKADMTYSKIYVPAGLMGQGKAEVIKLMGVPDSVAQAGEVEYWGYTNMTGYFVLLFGKTVAEDVVLEFKDGKVISSYLADKGSSLGILISQGAVAE